MSPWSFPLLRALNEAVAQSPFVLAEQHRTEFRQSIGRIVERSQDRLAILDRESNKILLGIEREKEHIGGVLQSSREQELSQRGDVPVGDGHTGEPHAGDAIRLTGQTNGVERDNGSRVAALLRALVGRGF